MPVAKKATKVKKTELTVDANGNYVIENEAQGLLALQKAVEIEEKITQIKLENDLDGKEATYQALRKALKEFQDANDILELTDGKYKSLLIERTASQWVFDDTDIPQGIEIPEGEEVKSIKTIFSELFPDEHKYKRMLNRITTRVLDKTKLDSFVKSGHISAEQLAPAFLNYVSTTYVKIGEKK